MRAEEIRGLMEAYSQVHQPQIITEEAIQQVADMWAEACMEIGVNFSDYTLDELTEAFIVDMSSGEISESVLNEYLGMDSAQNAGAGLRQAFGKARRAVGSAVSKVAGGVKDVAGAGAQGLIGQKTTSSNPLAKAANLASRVQTAVPRAAASFAGGLLTGKSTSPSKPSAAPTKSKFAGARDAAFEKAKQIKGSPVVGPKPSASPTPTKPAAAPSAAKPAATSTPKPTATPAPAKPAKPAGSAMDQWAAANPKLAAAKAERDRTRGTSATTNPLMKDMKSSMPAPKSPAPSTAKTGFDLAKKGVNLAAGIDIFDLVKGHLLDEGYAETEENALVMMANMSEEWRKSILEAHGVEILDEAQEARENPEKHEEEKEKEDEKKYGKVRGEKTPMPPRGDKRREDFEKWYAKHVR